MSVHDQENQQDFLIHNVDVVSLSTEDETLKEVEYYLIRKDIRELIEKNWPELVEIIDQIIIPKLSNHPDSLETEEVEKRKIRIARLSLLPPMEALHALLYEEFFGADDNPGQNISEDNLPAPSPGGLLSHAYFTGTFNGESLESVSKLPFVGETAKEAIDSLSGYGQKNKLIDILSQLTYPGFDYMSEYQRVGLRTAMRRENYVSSSNVNRWSFRLVRMVKNSPEMTEHIRDQTLVDIIMPGAKGKFSVCEYWYRLWSTMSKKMIHQIGDKPYFNSPDSADFKQAIGEMLYIRLHPETQVMFKYISPSGYLNEIDRPN